MWRPLIILLLAAFAAAQVHIKIVDTKRGPETIIDEDDDDEIEVQYKVPEPVAPVGRQNPCYGKQCGRGKECVLTEKHTAKCVCYRKCEDEPDERFKVCSVQNETFASECHLDRAKCLCKEGHPECTHANPKRLRLDYFGSCKELTPCQEWEMEQFPDRMRNWTFVVMKEMARRNELGEYIDLLETATADDHHTDAVIWKFCKLDVTQDKHVSRRELLMVIATIKRLEHCIVPFLNKCDDNGDHVITLQEWAHCLGADQVQIQDKCHEIRSRQKRT